MNQKSTYLYHPAGLVFNNKNSGWYISRLNSDNKLEQIIGPLGSKNICIQESLNYFPHVYIIDENFSIFYIETKDFQEINLIQDSITNFKEAQQIVICLLKIEKIRNKNEYKSD